MRLNKAYYYWCADHGLQNGYIIKHFTIGQSPCLVGRCHDLIYSTQLLHIVILLHYWLGSWDLKRRGKFCRVTETRLTPRSPDSSTRLPSGLPYCELLSARPPALTLQPRLVLLWHLSKPVKKVKLISLIWFPLYRLFFRQRLIKISTHFFLTLQMSSFIIFGHVHRKSEDF